MSGPDWEHIPAAKRWLEQRFVASAAAGSPLLQYLIDIRTRGLPTRRREDHLTTFELMKWLSACKITGGIRYTAEGESIVFYPEYQPPTFALYNTAQHSTSGHMKECNPLKRSSRSNLRVTRSMKAKQKATLEQVSDMLQMIKEAEEAELRSTSAKQIKPEVLRQSEERRKALRPGVRGRKRGSTDLYCLDNDGRSVKKVL